MMSEILSNATVLLVAILLVFSWAMPVQANNPTGASERPLSEETPPAPTEDAPSGGNEINTIPSINVWYNQSLRFGQIGNPQEQVNILGNARDPDGREITRLTYRLNSGSSVSTRIGPDGSRLENPGDFNIALDTSALNNGTNRVVITATDASGESRSIEVPFTYTRGRTWPLPYTTNWETGSINDQAQVVDGLWENGSFGVRPHPDGIGYDRVIAIGDMTWRNYEIIVPITVHNWRPVGNDPGGVGLIAYWQGHDGNPPLPSDWTQIGAYAYYSNRWGALALRKDGANPQLRDFSFNPGRTYMFKLRAETVGANGRYSFKVWEQGQPEPSWLMNVTDDTEQRLSGSMLLVAHRVDATFGDVMVCPMNTTYPLSVSVNGGGSVAVQPNRSTFQCGEEVTLTARPDEGWVFTGWSGSQSASSSRLSFNMMGANNITANFRQSQPGESNNQLFIPSVTK